MRNASKRRKPCKAVYAALLTVMLVALPALSINCANSKTTLHPITDADIKPLKAGDSFSATKDGWWISDYYMTEIMEARVK